MSSTTTSWSTQGNTKAGSGVSTSDSLTTGTLTADTLQLASNVIKASDGGTTITLDTSDNVTIGGGLDTTEKITAKGGILIGNGTSSVNTVTIASGVADISATSGGFIQLTSESSTTDNLDAITIAGAQPTNGYILYLRPTTGHTITLRTGSHSSVTDGVHSIRCNENVGDSSSPFNMTLVTSFDISTVVNVIHLLYSGGRWVVLGHDVDVMRTGE